MREFFVCCYYFLTSLSLAALPLSFLMKAIFDLLTLNCLNIVMLPTQGEWIGNIFSIAKPSVVFLTVIVFSRGVFQLVLIIRPLNFWVLSLFHSLMIVSTSTSIQVLNSGISFFRKSFWISFISWVFMWFAINNSVK